MARRENRRKESLPSILSSLESSDSVEEGNKTIGMSSLELNEDQLSIVQSAFNHNSNKHLSCLEPNIDDLWKSD